MEKYLVKAPLMCDYKIGINNAKRQRCMYSARVWKTVLSKNLVSTFQSFHVEFFSPLSLCSFPYIFQIKVYILFTRFTRTSSFPIAHNVLDQSVTYIYFFFSSKYLFESITLHATDQVFVISQCKNEKNSKNLKNRVEFS